MDSDGINQPERSWRRPSYCHGGECAEIAKLDGMISLRSSTSPSSVVRYTTEEWQALVRAIRAGEFADLD
jgi:hypothetical protein